jgi:hypothetical protein
MTLSTPTPTSIEQQTQILIKHYQKALLIKPNSATLYQKIGNLYRSFHDFEKELRYFTLSPVQDIDYYLSHFPAISDRNYLMGEATPSYISSPSTAKKVWSQFPDIKLIILLRNPVEHTLSCHYPALSPVLRQQLADFFRPYNQELEEYLGMKFNWE